MKSISVVCTDAGQHHGTTLGDLSVTGGLLRANNAYTYGEVAGRRKDECVWLDQLDTMSAEYRVHMRCPRCGRHVQWRHENAVKVVAAFAAEGMATLDISTIR